MNGNHLQGVGPTGSGKSTGEGSRIGPATVTLDPHGSLADVAAIKCSDENIPCVIDCLARTDLVVPWQFLIPIDGNDYQADLLRNEVNYAFADIVARDQQRDGIRANPLIEEWLIKALTAWHRNPVVPLTQLHRVLDPMSEEFRMIDSEELEPLAFMNVYQQRQEVGAAKRMLSRMSPAFKARCHNVGWDFVSFLNDGGVFVIDGNGLSIDSTRMVMGAVSLSLITAAKRGMFQRPITLVIDEASKIIGSYETAAIEEMRKYGLFIHLLDQTGDYGLLTPRIWQNCGRKEIYGVDDGGLAIRFAQLLKTPTLNPMEVHYEEYVPRQVHDGYESIVDRETERVSYLSQYRVMDDQRTHYQSLDNQIRLFAKELMNLKQNERYVKEGNNVFLETFDLYRPRFSFGISEENAWQHVNNWTTRHAISPSQSSVTMPARSTTSNAKSGSKATRRPHGEWRRSANEDQ
ncbi:hypothetical protein [Aporhodopirellula aestuarii]|uniref:Uncharacterized protein n=1 Tax=Aporhodopirellula aestuarii TaxID=2950107 RepID=A0ABT0U5F0_9BACT|nr:hypothetical protein [Aporhodopirellula aestuarii]MCM2372081.1 hypothetical protein [Aporhodopirellula aestuarii]